VDNLTLEQVNNLLSGNAGTQVTLSVKQIGQTIHNITLTRQQLPPNGCFSETDLLPLLSSQLNMVEEICWVEGPEGKELAILSSRINLQRKLLTPTERFSRTKKNIMPIGLTFRYGFDLSLFDNITENTIRDPEANFELYNSFDFEYTDVNNPIQEKQLATILQSYLEEKGLKRDKVNPDLLVFITSYSGDKKQYVPPTQQVTTRYQFGYDIWSGFGNKQYIESQQQGGYTQVTYIASLKVVFMDAHKTKQQPKIPPIVWQSQYQTESLTRIDILSAAELIVYKWMIRQCYPTNNLTNYFAYDQATTPDKLGLDQTLFYFTGICYNKKTPNKVAYIYPESPAEKAGVQVGDIVTSVNNRLLPATQKELTEDFIHKVKKQLISNEPYHPNMIPYGLLIHDSEGKINASILDNPKYKAGLTYIEGAYLDPKTTYTFEVNRNGSTQTFSIAPEKRIGSWVSDDDGQKLFLDKK